MVYIIPLKALGLLKQTCVRKVKTKKNKGVVVFHGNQITQRIEATQFKMLIIEKYIISFRILFQTDTFDVKTE